MVRWESERPQSLARLEVRGRRAEIRIGNGRSTRLHYATAWPANDELTFVLVLIIVIEAQEKGQKFATLKR